MDYEELVLELKRYMNEEEWFEFKANWYEPKALGEYISALSNAASMQGRKEAYFIWGIDDETHEVVGTDFDPYVHYRNEPLQNYLARGLEPSVHFTFREVFVENKRVVVLVIPAAKDVPTSFLGERYTRIGSAKVNMRKYPQREKELFKILESGYPTISNTKSAYQDLSFTKLFGYYGSKGIVLKKSTFKKNLGLLTESGEYNVLAQLLSDDSKIPFRVSIFDGTSKSSHLFSVREFGYNCLLYSLEEVLRYGDVLNIIQADEENRVVERKDIPLFDSKAFNEAIINAVLHNKWVEGNEPMISVFSDRLEILSRGGIAPTQTMEGFFNGESIPVNEKLSEIFLQLHISEKSGRGVPTITDTYGRQAFDFRENSIVVTIPFHWINKVGYKVGKKSGPVKLTANRKQILAEIRNNPNVTKKQLSVIVGISTTAVDKNIQHLRENGYIERVGSNKTGYWKIKN